MAPDDRASSAPAEKLPDPANLDLLRKRSKRLLREARGGDAAALARCRSASPRFSSLSDEQLARELRLADAQHAVARLHGFASWPKLVRHVEDLQPLSAHVEAFLAAIRDQRTKPAATLLARYPAIARADLHAACACGEPEIVATLVEKHPERVSAARAGDGTPLIYACASPLYAESTARARRIHRCAELLLDHGASTNESILFNPEDPHSRIPALYFACVSGHRDVVELLLDRGAEPNDGESIYHAAELDRRDCLELLVAHGADPSSAHSHWGNTPLYFLAGWKEGQEHSASATSGMQWLLEHGADPNVPSLDVRETPLHRAAANGRSPALVEMLLEHGAVVDQPRADGRTAYALALRTGNAPAAALLLARGADPTKADPLDELLGVCMAADGAPSEGRKEAHAILASHPDVLSQLGDGERDLLGRAAEEKREATVRLMHELGFDIAWQGAAGGTPLHRAAWHGDPSMTRLLLSLEAPVNVRDGEFGCSPLAWAAHGSVHCRRADDDYRAVVDLLLDAGSDRETSINRWGEGPEALCSRAVERLLRRRGFVPPGDPAVETTTPTTE
jgi:ankyrin repeat protein